MVDCLLRKKNIMLPILPKKIKNDEAKFGIALRQWVEKNYERLESCTFELKDTRGKDSFPFSELKDIQRVNALRTESSMGNLVRISVGTPGASDYSYHRLAQAYIVIKYPKKFHMIRIGKLIEADRISDRRSLTEEGASEIADLSVKI